MRRHGGRQGAYLLMLLNDVAEARPRGDTLVGRNKVSYCVILVIKGKKKSLESIDVD